MRPFILSLLTSAVLLATTTFAADSSTEKTLQEALKSSELEANLRHLTDEIGGRVPGTPAMQRAVSWGVASFTRQARTTFTPKTSPSRTLGRGQNRNVDLFD